MEQLFEFYQTQPKIMYHIYWTLQIFWSERWRHRQKWLLWLNNNPAMLKSQFLSSIAWIHPGFLIFYYICNSLEFHMGYIFRSGNLLGDAHSKYIFIILVIDSWNIRKLQKSFAEFEWNKTLVVRSKIVFQSSLHLM